MLTRRTFLAGALGPVMAPALTSALTPALALAAAPTERRLVVVLLRGALDGLAAVPAPGDGGYRRARGALALDGPGAADGVRALDGFFGLHPSLETLHRWYGEGEALAVHAVASPYRGRSHFDAQNLLENGTLRPFGADDGWLNRALAAMPAQRREPARALGIAVGHGMPLMMRGAQPVNSWAPSALPDASEDTLARILDLYQRDPFLASRLTQAIETQAMVPEDMAGGRRGRTDFAALAGAAGGFLADPDGARVAMLELGGFDTHANQGAARGTLAGRLGALDRGLAALRERLGNAWAHTAVIVVSEFGRTVRPNGTRGTDHGTAGVALLAGGAVAGGRVIADWPGLSGAALHEGRDLRPTTDMRSVLKGVLHAHLQVPESALEREVFPDSAPARPLEGLVSA